MGDADLQPSTEDMARAYLLCYAVSQFEQYQIAKHHQVIAAHLEALERREIKRLLITMPPRSGKTMLTSEFFAAWYMGRHPEHEIMFSTYSKERAMDIGLKVKNQLESNAYQETFTTELSSNSKSKAHLATTAGGAFYAVGVGGAMVGRGANLFLMDDLVKSREDAESEVSRKRLIEWYRGTAYTRLMPGGIICLTMTRWHNFDLAGTIISEFKKDWVHLDLPAICEKKRDSIGRKRGEALWPEMFSLKDLKEIRKVIGSREFNAQYQQRPIGEEGSIIKLDWFNRYVRRPSQFRRIIQSWDTAYDGKSMHDPSVCTVWGEFVDRNSTTYFLLDVWRQRVDYPIVKKAIFSMYQRWPGTHKILIENRTSGKSIVKDLQQTNLPILPILGQGSKEIRAMSVSGLIESGKVCIPETAKWLYEFENEVVQFPLGKHDDQVDSMTQALEYLKKPSFYQSIKPQFWK